MIKKITPKTTKDMIGMSSKEPEPRYPHLRMELEFIPEAKKWEIGKEYTIEMQVKMTGISISRFQNDAEFDIVGMSEGEEAGKTMGMHDKKMDKKMEGDDHEM